MRELELRVNWLHEKDSVVNWRYDDLVGDWVRDKSYEKQQMDADHSDSQFYETAGMESEDNWAALRKTCMTSNGDGTSDEGVCKAKPWILKKKLVFRITRPTLNIDWFSMNRMFNGILI